MKKAEHIPSQEESVRAVVLLLMLFAITSVPVYAANSIKKKSRSLFQPILKLFGRGASQK